MKSFFKIPQVIKFFDTGKSTRLPIIGEWILFLKIKRFFNRLVHIYCTDPEKIISKQSGYQKGDDPIDVSRVTAIKKKLTKLQNQVEHELYEGLVHGRGMCNFGNLLIYAEMSRETEYLSGTSLKELEGLTEVIDILREAKEKYMLLLAEIACAHRDAVARAQSGRYREDEDPPSQWIHRNTPIV